jgi:hypothetical protein
LPASDEFEDGPQTPQGVCLAEPGWYDEISPPAFHPVGRLRGEDRLQPRIGHSRPSHDPLSLQPSGCGNDDNLVAKAIRARLEQKRDVECDYRLASAASHCDEPLFGGTHNRVKDALQLPQRLWLTENTAAQRRTVDSSCRIPDTGKRRFDTCHRCPARRQQTMNRRISVE